MAVTPMKPAGLERVALIGLREVSDEESRLIRRSRISAYTLEDVDALGVRDVNRLTAGTATGYVLSLFGEKNPHDLSLPAFIACARRLP